MSGVFRSHESSGVGYLTIPSFEEAGPVRAWFSTRLGGVSRPPYATLNLGFHVGDDPAAVAENRARLCLALGVDQRTLVAARQVHGDRVQVVGAEDAGRGAVDGGLALPDADALVTRDSGVVLTAYYADCVPVCLYDPRAGAVGLAHAGWKGTVGETAAKAVRKMVEAFGSDPGDCLAAIGPSIGPCCYEVDEKVVGPLAQAFEDWPDLVRPSGRQAADRPGKWKLDLWEANRRSLLRAGLRSENILVGGLCTACRRDIFFSHRAEGGRTGRLMALVSKI